MQGWQSCKDRGIGMRALRNETSALVLATVSVMLAVAWAIGSWSSGPSATQLGTINPDWPTDTPGPATPDPGIKLTEEALQGWTYGDDVTAPPLPSADATRALLPAAAIAATRVSELEILRHRARPSAVPVIVHIVCDVVDHSDPDDVPVGLAYEEPERPVGSPGRFFYEVVSRKSSGLVEFGTYSGIGLGPPFECIP